MQIHHKNYPVFAVDARVKDDVLLLIESLIAMLECQMLAVN
jgi:hypothetical protein